MRLSRIKIALVLSLLLSLAGVTLALAGDNLPGGLLAWSGKDTRNRLLTENHLQYATQVNQSEDILMGGNLFKLGENQQVGSAQMERLRKQYRYQECLDCVPQGEMYRHGQSENQPGPQHRNQYCEDCTPAGDEHKNGQDDSHPDPPHQNTNCDDCDPVGDEYKYGQEESPPDPPHQNQDCHDCLSQGNKHQNRPENDQAGAPRP